MTSPTVAAIVAALGGEAGGDAQLAIERIAPLADADAAAISFLASPKLRAELPRSGAGCIILQPELRDEASAARATIATADPYLYFARLTQWWAARERVSLPRGVHPSAVVDAAARVDATACIGALAVVEAGAVIEAGAEIGAQCHIGQGVRIGAGTRLAPQVVVGARCSIGARGIIHSGVVIGADGFGFAPRREAGGTQWEKIEQLGAVRIGDDVEIGANTCIDRGALADTVIGDGVKLDNLIQIAHNVRIGAHTAMAGCAAVAGSTTIGAHCTVAGAARIIGHLSIADHVHVSVDTCVTRSIREPGIYSGSFPFDRHAAWEKNAATLRQLHALRERVRALERRLPGEVSATDADSAS